MRYLVIAYIKMLEKDRIINTRKCYSAIYTQFPEACERLGFTAKPPIEEKWKNQIRWGLRDAQDQKLIRHIGSPKSGLWERI
jgi:hypothetical protein